MAKTVEELASQLDQDQEFKSLAPDEQDRVFADLAKDFGPASTTPAPGQVKTRSYLESDAGKALFRGGGQMVGGIVAAAPTVAAAPGTGGLSLAGTAPAVAAGGMAGAMTGESLRQFLVSLQGGDPGEMLPEHLKTLKEAAVGEMIFPAAGAVAKPLLKTAKFMGKGMLKHVPDEALSFIRGQYKQGVDVLDQSVLGTRQAILRSVQNMKDAISHVHNTPSLTEPPSPSNLFPVADKAIQALDAVKGAAMKRYGAAASHAIDQPAQASLVKSAKGMKMDLTRMNLLDKKGREIPFGTGKRAFTSEERTLLDIYDEFRGVSAKPTENLPDILRAPGTVATGQGPKPTGATRPGTAISFQQAQRLLARIEEALGRVTTRNAKRILIETQRHIKEGLKLSDTELGKAAPEYARFASLRDVLERAFKDPDRAVGVLMSSMRDTRQGLMKNLEELDKLAPDEFKFVQELKDFKKAIDLSDSARRAPKAIMQKIGRMTDDQIENFILNIYNQPETVKVNLEALDAIHPFLDQAKAVSAARMFREIKPEFSPVTTATMGVLGAGGYAAEGPIGAAGGLVASTLAASPRVQGSLLRKAMQAEAAYGGSKYVKPGAESLVRIMKSPPGKAGIAQTLGKFGEEEEY